MSKTPLEKIQDEAAQLLPPTMDLARAALDAFLLQAFDAGIQAHRELMEAVVLSDQENFRRKTARGRLDDPNYRARGDSR